MCIIATAVLIGMAWLQTNGYLSKDMRYLVTINGNPPFLTKWFEYDNHWQDGINMVVCDLQNLTYTQDGKTWHPIRQNQL